MRFRRRNPASVARVSISWSTLLLLFVVLVPSVCLLWFVNRAAENEQLAVRQKLVDAYRAHLLLAQERIQSHWLRAAPELTATLDREPAAILFARLVREQVADAVVCFGPDGLVSYPNQGPRLPPAPTAPEWRAAGVLERTNPKAAAVAYSQIATAAPDTNTAARALQAQARCLAGTGDRLAAIEILTTQLAAEQFSDATDTQGRLIAPNAALLALELLPPEQSTRRHLLATQIAARSLNYADAAMSSAQRRFLLRGLTGAVDAGAMPADTARMLAAEDLAERWLANASNTSREVKLQASGVENVDQFALPGGRIVLLHRTATLVERLRTIIAQPDLPRDVRIDFLPPGDEADGALLTLPAGTAMPDWRLALVPLDPHALDAVTSARSTSYVWIGAVAVLTAVLLALLTWELLRRQLALTRLRNDLVANVTHELKTPLSSMRLFVETLLDSERLDEQTTREYLELIAQENLRLSRLIDNFLTFSRIERNKYAYAFAPVPAARLAEEAAAAVRERFASPGCTFTAAIAPDLPTIQADADSLVTALTNLLDNAYKYTPDAKEIALAATANDGTVVFSVRDNGIGLVPRDAKRIFRRFYQVRPHGSPASGGCGLGLSIVHSIVTAHRGTIQVSSQPGRGSTFTIILPAS
jgi:signal transduction histidine kinase